MQWSAETNAAITALFFKWLVGPLETKDVEVEFKGDKHTWRSGVQIKKCRCAASAQALILSAVSGSAPASAAEDVPLHRCFPETPYHWLHSQEHSVFGRAIAACAGIWSNRAAWACASTCARHAPLLMIARHACPALGVLPTPYRD